MESEKATRTSYWKKVTGARDRLFKKGTVTLPSLYSLVAPELKGLGFHEHVLRITGIAAVRLFSPHLSLSVETGKYW